MALTNQDVAVRAKQGGEGHNGRRSMGTEEGLCSFGYLPQKLVRTLQQLRYDTQYRVEHTVYSYDTPIAFKIAGVWLVPDARYSPTTSTKHQSQLWVLGAQYIPCDLSLEELVRVIEGKMVYHRAPAPYGRWVPGPNYIEGE